MRPDEAREALKRLSDYQDVYLGAAELAQICGFTVQAISNCVRRGTGPTVHTHLAMSPIWRRDKVYIWLMEKSK